MKTRWIVLIVLSLAIVVLLLGLGLGLGLKPKPLRDSFISTCTRFEKYNCERLWQMFEKAYVGKNPCNVPQESYNDLMAAAPFEPDCNNMMLWSKNKDFPWLMTHKRRCYTQLESTVLGASLDGKTWCGNESSQKTFTEGCPRWDKCLHNPVRSFWLKASGSFAESACGDVTVMLDGSLDNPFVLTSVFASVELPLLKAPAVTSLTAVLVTDSGSASACDNSSLKKLQEVLHGGVKYVCREVSKARLHKCSTDTTISCKSCW